MKEPTVTVSDDRMTAFVSAEAGKRVAQDAAARLIFDALTQMGVLHGVDETAVRAAAQMLSCGTPFEPRVVARGTPGTPAAEAGLRFTVPVYRESDLPPALVKKLQQVVTYPKLLSYIKNPHIVSVNEIVGCLRSAVPARSGRTVYGEQVPPPMDSGEVRCDCLGAGLVQSADGPEVIAQTRGILLAQGFTCVVVPVNVNGTFTVTVAKDRMSVAVSLHAPGPGGRAPRMDEILLSVKGMGVVADQDQSQLRGALESLSAGSARVIREVRVAAGRPPRPGTNARIELLVHLSSSHASAKIAPRNDDYYRSHAFESVVAGQNLARLRESTPGEAGVDVYGSVVKVSAGRPEVLKIGRNVVQSKVDLQYVIAAVGGHVYYRNDRLEVDEVLRVKGDVDQRTGKIEFSGDVVVEGDVRSGLSIRAGGSVWVLGAVEDAAIEARRDIVVKSGFVGQGTGVLSAGGDVVVAFVRGQVIHARNSIMVTGEVFNARLRAGSLILVEAEESVVLGGELLATRGVRVSTLGNEVGRFTKVRVGVDPIAEARIRQLDGDISRSRRALDAERAAAEENGPGDTGAGGMAEDMMSTHESQPSALEQAEQKITRLTNLRKKLAAELYVEGSEIHVNAIVYPDVVVAVGKLPHLVREERCHCRFYGERGRVHCAAL